MELRPILDVYKATEVLPEDLDAAFNYVFYCTVLRQAYAQYPELARFSGMTQEAARRRFQELDRTLIGLKRRQLTIDLAHTGSLGASIGVHDVHGLICILLGTKLASRRDTFPCVTCSYVRAGLSSR